MIQYQGLENNNTSNNTDHCSFTGLREFLDEFEQLVLEAGGHEWDDNNDRHVEGTG